MSPRLLWNLFRGFAKLSLVGLILWPVSKLFGFPITIAVGVLLWSVSSNVVVVLFGAYLIDVASNRFPMIWRVFRARARAMPKSVIDLATELHVSPPKKFKVVPDDRIFASISEDTLVVSALLNHMRWTSVWRAVIGHELGHSSREHSIRGRTKVLLGLYALLCSALLITALLLESSSNPLLIAYVTMYLCAVVCPWVTHRAELAAVIPVAPPEAQPE